MFTFIAYFHNFRTSSFLLMIFFRLIASLILFTLLTLLFPIFCVYFTLFPQFVRFYFVLPHQLPVNCTERPPFCCHACTTCPPLSPHPVSVWPALRCEII